MMKVRKKWTNEDLFEEAAKYETYKEFRTLSRSASEIARTRGLLEDIKDAFFGDEYRKWTESRVIKEASKYTTRTEFRKCNVNAYNTGVRYGLLSEINEILDAFNFNSPRKWTHETIAIEAKKYLTRNEFAVESNGAACAAKKFGIYEDVCAHMSIVNNMQFGSVRLKRGLYFLYQDDVIVYVGKTYSDIAHRLGVHYRDDIKSFNRVIAYEIDNEADIGIAEMYFISKYSPVYNKDSNYSTQSTLVIDNMESILTNEYEFNLGEES